MMPIVRICMLLMLIASAVSAQDDVTDQPHDTALGRSAFEQGQQQSDLAVRINFCRQLMRNRNYEDASAMLEQLYDQNPQNPVVVSLLIQCYDQLQYYQKAEEIIRRYLATDPGNFNFQVYFAEVIAKQGDFERARKAYLDAAWQFPVTNILRYQAVVQSMISNDMSDDAVSLIDSLRTLTADSTLFALQRGTVLERKKLYGQAAHEFYLLLDDTTRLGNDAEQRLSALLEFPESAAAAESVFVSRGDLLKTPRALKVLSAHYLKSEQYDRAFEFTVSCDSVGGFDGDAILAFMRSCSERRLYDQTARAGEYLLSHYGSRNMPGAAQVAYAEALVELGRNEEAVSVYEGIFASSRKDVDKADLLYRLGMVYMQKPADYNRALIYFDSVAAYYAGFPAYMKVIAARPHAYLRQGQLAQAKFEFAKILARPSSNELKEEALYFLALTSFFEKKIDTARATLEKLLVDYPDGFYVNDAVRLLFTFSQADRQQQVLYDYSNALLFEQMKMVDSACSKLELIAESPERLLADMALYELARLRGESGNVDQAIGYIDRLVEGFPDSYYLPYGLKIKADIFSTQPEKVEKAREIYRNLLENHPGFPLISAVRQKIRELDERYGSS